MTLHLLCGIPGSGKSTLVQRLPGYIVSTDTLRKFLWNDEAVVKHDSLVFEISELIVRYQLSNGRDVIFDATNLTVGKRKRFIDIARHFSTPVVLHWVKCPLKTAIERNNNRARKVPEKVIKALYKSFQLPRPEEGFHLIKVYDTNSRIVRVESSIKKVIRGKKLTVKNNIYSQSG